MSNFLQALLGANSPAIKTHFDDLIQSAITGASSGTRIAFRYLEAFRKKVKRRLGASQYVDIDGTEYQDLGNDEGQHRIVAFFEGANHPNDARQFEALLQERAAKGSPARWEHPRGQVIDVVIAQTELVDDPNKDANRTFVYAEIYEQLTLPADIRQRPDIAVQKQLENFNAAAGRDLSLGLILDTVSDQVAAIREAMSAVNIITETMGAILDTNASVLADFNGIKTDISNNINTLIESPEVLAASFTRLIQAGLQFPGGFADKSRASREIVDRSLGLDDENSASLSTSYGDSQTRNRAHIQSLTASAASAAMLSNVVQNIGDFTTKQSAYDAATNAMKSVKDIIKAAESIEALYSTDEFQNQYFGLTESLSELYTLSRICYAATQELTTNLPATRVITTTSDVHMYSICFDAYGDDFESYLQSFIDINDLTLEEMLIIPAGRRLLV